MKTVDSQGLQMHPHENANVSQVHYENEYLKKKPDDLTVLHENAVALHSQEKQDPSNKLDRSMQLVSQEQSNVIAKLNPSEFSLSGIPKIIMRGMGFEPTNSCEISP